MSFSDVFVELLVLVIPDVAFMGFAGLVVSIFMRAAFTGKIEIKY